MHGYNQLIINDVRPMRSPQQKIENMVLAVKVHLHSQAMSELRMLVPVIGSAKHLSFAAVISTSMS